MPNKILKRYFLNYSILIPYLILNVVGLIMIYSSTSYMKAISGENSAKIVITQAVFFVVSLILMLIIYKTKIDFLKNTALIKILFVVGITLLVTTLIFGAAINGSKGWLRFGPVSIQPAEYFKFLIPWFLANEFSKRQHKIKNKEFVAFCMPLFMILMVIALVVLMPDLGNAVILTLLLIVLLSISGISYRWTVIFAPVFILGSFFFNQVILAFKGKFVPSYVYSRFQAFANPFAKGILQDQGHQLANSYYAIYNGGWFGRGLGNSIEKKGYLPEAHTDFIFPVVVEELGVLVSLLILGLLIYLITRILLVGIRATKPFNSIIALGVGGMMFIQLFINLGGVIGLIPSTGVTFPFLSQGGNSILVLSVSIALVLNISADESRTNYQLYHSQYAQND
ncbi:MAG: FtsW/RodA/SpoVE family cell cycle protein [Streptococcaceae bacterium]|jgi:cell division protein FtsW|nr:FtsW/RodA/SpoVE family cell cycle protein [Streptococcaceae bacterium]